MSKKSFFPIFFLQNFTKCHNSPQNRPFDTIFRPFLSKTPPFDPISALKIVKIVVFMPTYRVQTRAPRRPHVRKLPWIPEQKVHRAVGGLGKPGREALVPVLEQRKLRENRW
jgi:hypothetical protein